MGKTSRKLDEDEDDRTNIKKKEKKISRTQMKEYVSNEINPKLIRMKKSKIKTFGDAELNRNCEIVEKTTTSMKVNVRTKNQDLITGDNIKVGENYVKRKNKLKKKDVQHETNAEKQHHGTDCKKKKLKKIKQTVEPKIIVNKEQSSNYSIDGKSKKHEIKIIQEGVSRVINDKKESSFQDTSNKNNKNVKKNKQNINIIHDEVQCSDEINTQNQEKPKKKKKRKIVEEEIVDDEELDRYCNELDEFHNKQFEDWVKLIEENLNKNPK